MSYLRRLFLGLGMLSVVPVVLLGCGGENTQKQESTSLKEETQQTEKVTVEKSNDDVLTAETANKTNTCLDNLKQYQLTSKIFNECINEASQNLKAPELHYTVGLWYVYGAYGFDFQEKPDTRKARHFLYLASKEGNLDAMAAYVITQHDQTSNDGTDNQGNSAEFMKALSADTSEKGILRYLRVLKATGKLTDENGVPELKKLAEVGNNEAALMFADYLFYQASISKDAEQGKNLINKSWTIYGNILKKLDDDDQSEEVKAIKSRIYWKFVSYYSDMSQSSTEHRDEAMKKIVDYLERLARMGDLLAASTLTTSYYTGEFGKKNEDKAFAWGYWLKQCATDSVFSRGVSKIVKELSFKVPVKVMDARWPVAESLLKDVKCDYKQLPLRDGDIQVQNASPAKK